MASLLFIDATPDLTRRLRRSARHSGARLTIRRLSSLEAACAAVRGALAPPDLIAVHIAHPDVEEDVQALPALARLAQSAELVVLLPAEAADRASRALEAGAHRCLLVPEEPARLLGQLIKLARQRTAPVQHHHLKILVDVAEQAQRADGLGAAGEIVVRAAISLGFTRARLWLLSDDRAWINGACQHGDPSLEDFDRHRLRVADSTYTQLALRSREPIIFRGQELGPWLLSDHFAARGFVPPVGEWVHMPLWAGRRCWGLLSLDNGAADEPIVGAKRALLRVFARQVAAALERAYLQEHEERQQRERAWLAAINAVAARAQRAETVQDVADVLVGAGAALGFERARLWLLDEEGQVAYGVSQAGNDGLASFSGFAFPVAESPYLRAVVEGRVPQFFEGLPYGPGYLMRAFGDQGYRAPQGLWCALPLGTSDQVRGVLMLDHSDIEMTLDEQQRGLLDLLARQASGALERARKSLERDWLAALVDLLQQTQEVQTPEEIAGVVVRAREGLGFERARLWRYDEATSSLVGLAQDGNAGLGAPFVGLSIPLAESSYGRLMSGARKPAFFPAAVQEESYLARRFGATGFAAAVGEWALIPLHWKDRFVGVLTLDNATSPRWIFPGQRDLLDLLGREVSAALERTRLLAEERRQHTARTWLEAFAQLSEEVQRALSREAVSKAIVQKARTLGFARARLWLLSDDGATLRCVEQAGHKAVDGLIGFELTLEEAVYVRHLSHGPDPKIFAGRSVAMAHLDAALVDRGFTPPAGEWASLPLWSNGAPRGLLVLDRGSDPRRLDPDHLALLTLLAREASAALDRVHLLEEERRHVEEERRHVAARDWLNELVKITTDPHNLPSSDAVAEVIVRGAQRLGFERARLWRLEGETIVGVRQSGNEGLEHFSGTRIALADLPYSQATLAASTPQIFEGRAFGPSGLDQRFASFGFQPPSGEWVEMPLMTGNGCWGLLTLDRIRHPQRLSAEDRSMISLFASHAGAALGRARDRRRLASREQELRAIGELMEWTLEVNMAAQQSDQDFERLERDFARTLLIMVGQLVGRPDVSAGLLLSRGGVLYTRGGDERRQRYRYYWLEGDNLRYEDRDKDLGKGITSIALSTGETQLVANVREDRWAAIFVPGHGKDTQSELDVAIRREGGQTIGVINLESPAEGAFSQTHQGMMERLARVAALTLINLQRQRLLNATLVAVTGLAAAGGREQIIRAIGSAIEQLSPDLSTLLIWERGPDSSPPRVLVLRDVYREGRRRVRTDRSALAAQTVMGAPNGLWLNDPGQVEDRDLHWLCRSQGLHSAIALPLMVEDDQPLGALLVGYRERRDFTLEERTLFPVVAAAIAANLRSLARQDALAAEGKRLKAALQIAGAVGTSQRLDEIFEAILTALSQIYPDTDIFLRLFDEQTGKLVLVPQCFPYYTITDHERNDPAGIDIDNPSLSATVARAFERTEDHQMTALNVGDVLERNDYLPLVARTRSQLTVVLASGTILLGAVGIESPRLNAFSDDDARALEEVSRQISQAIMRARIGARLRRTLLISARTTWAALLAHDINSEIANIRNHLFLARHFARPDPDAEEHFSAIDRHAARLAGTMGLVQQEGDQGLSRFLLNAWLAREIPAMLASDSYTFHIAHQCPEVEVELHAFLLRTALLLLVRNAREAMGPSGRLTVRTRCERLMVEIEIEDSGPGVPDHVRQHLFEESHSSKVVSRGLGLLFVRLLAEDMGGSVRLLPPAPGRGAVFVLRLPINSQFPLGGSHA